MRKLMKLRQTVLVEEAAEYLSAVLEDKVGVEDLYALAHDREIKLSVSLPTRIWVRKVHLFDTSQEAAEHFGQPPDALKRIHVERLGTAFLDPNDETIEPPAELAMLGGEVEFIRALAWGRRDNADAFYFDEILLRTSDGALWSPGTFQIIKDRRYPEIVPWYSLPEETRLCVRVSELSRLVDKLECDGVQPNALSPHPPLWPAHETKKLAALRAAANKFYGENYVPGDIDTTPRNEDVADWLVKNQGVVPTLADVMASILRPDDARAGRRPSFAREQ